MINKEDARHIIDLNPYNIIDEQIAERQFEVIVKAYNHLSQENNNFIYIADEVGLGKTFVALGIASLLRRFCKQERRANYKDVILVPKQNLQHKWNKEINNFVVHNYKSECNIVKSVLGKPIGNCGLSNIHQQLELFSISNPSYEIYRNSSFSIATSGDAKEWQQKLQDLVPLNLKHIFTKGINLFGKNEEDFIYLKRLYAFLLNVSFPEIDLLIVDEAHNFKHGVDDGVAIRNQIVSRLMGYISEEDKLKIFNQIPELNIELIKPKAKKVIFLSATPIDNGLHEIKQQFDCFLPNHKFSKSEAISVDIKNALNSFMIRGLMNITLHNETENEGKVSRNMYRHEHRRGNVEKLLEANPQYIKDNLESIILGIMQYKTLKHFDESNNKSFEIGMLAAFETFNTKTQSDQEYEETSNRTNIKSADQGIVQRIASSYFDKFKSHLPHPKQDNMVDVLFNGLKNQTKSLVFVRRIASVIELERKLNLKVEEWQFEKIKKYSSRSNRLKALEKSFNERHQIFEIERIIELLAEKILRGNKTHFSNLVEDDNNLSRSISENLIVLYHSERTDIDLELYRQLILKHINLSNIKTELSNVASLVVTKYLKEIKELNTSDKEEQFTESQDEVMSYFFSSYFSSKRYLEGFNFRKLFGTRDWYKFNYYHLQNNTSNFHFDTSKLVKITFDERDKTASQRMAIINERLLESYESARRNKGIPNYTEVDETFKKKTFFNLLLEGPLSEEYLDWLSIKLENPSKGYSFIDDLDVLIELFQGVFRNGSGLLPAYIAECIDGNNFETTLLKILLESYQEVIVELKQIIVDFDKILSANFSDRSKIQRAMYGQFPVSGASGFHKRDVSRVATQFRMPGYPYVLITTDVLKEGEDLHLYCKDVYHYGIAWNPSDMEQRTGRIDRINSSSYFELKKEGKINFNNSLQVFYPYLADTLEVNQVAKVFNKMNDFIQTFYDISVIREKDTLVSTDDIVKEIPVQIKDFLTSKYDHDNNHWPEYIEKTTENLNPIGESKENLNILIESTLNLIKLNFDKFNIYPYRKENQFSIHANIDLNGRRAPLIITLVNGVKFNEIIYAIDSIIGRSTHSELRKINVRAAIRTSLSEKDMELKENNDYLLVHKLMSINESHANQIKIIKSVLIEADELEEKYTGGDEEGFK
jgi:hypothetical protein